MKALTKVLMVIGLMLSTFAITAPSEAFACPANAYVDSKGEWVGGTKEQCEGLSDDLNGKVLRFVKIISTLVVVFAVGMIIYGGFKYVSAQGDPKQAETAKQQIFHAAIGLFIVLAAFTILQLFLGAAGGAPTI